MGICESREPEDRDRVERGRVASLMPLDDAGPEVQLEAELDHVVGEGGVGGDEARHKPAARNLVASDGSEHLSGLPRPRGLAQSRARDLQNCLPDHIQQAAEELNLPVDNVVQGVTESYWEHLRHLLEWKGVLDLGGESLGHLCDSRIVYVFFPEVRLLDLLVVASTGVGDCGGV